jgi:hypothetical protein
MDDDDLLYNFKKARRIFWLKHGLNMPDNVSVVFRKIPKSNPRHTDGCVQHTRGGYKIIINPLLKFSYVAAHITLFHEMAHLYLMASNCRGDHGHGKTFWKEIDRLYSLKLYRKLL